MILILSDVSLKHLEELMSKLPNQCEIIIQSNDDVDKDFITLCCAGNLVLSGQSGYGLAARFVNDYLKNHN